MLLSLSTAWHWWISLPWNVWLDYSDKTVRIAAVLVGGSWAYMKFVKGRIYYLRLEPSVTGRHIMHTGRDYLIATVRVKNVGASKVDIEQRGTALRVFGYPLTGDATLDADIPWTRLGTVTIFAKNSWVEASETIDDTVMVPLPPHLVALHLELLLIAKKQRWFATAIIDVPEQSG